MSRPFMDDVSPAQKGGGRRQKEVSRKAIYIPELIHIGTVNPDFFVVLYTKSKYPNYVGRTTFGETIRIIGGFTI